MEVIDIDGLKNNNLWNRLFQESKYASFFQTEACYDFYTEITGFTPFVYGIKNDENLKGVIVGYIQSDGGKIKSFLSRRAIINAGPLLSDDISDEELSLLLFTVKRKLSGKAIYIEMRNFFDYSRFKKTFKKCGFEYRPHLNFQIDTRTETAVLNNMGKSRKRDIRVSIREGAELVLSPSKAQVEEYYHILENLYKTKVKTPLFPLSFFQILNSHDYGKLILVKYGDEIIGGTVCVGIEGTPLYEWFACGKDGRYKNVYASTLATYGGIEYAYKNRFPIFDMMGAGKPNEGYGVRDFKAKFGGKLVEDGRYLCVLNPLLYNIGKLGVSILKKMK